MGNKLLRSILIAIFSFAASVGMASCSVMIDGNTHTTSDSSTGPHSHNYNQQVVTDAYKVSNADCEHAATYYYSCSCGNHGTETFEYGSPLGHDWHYEYFQTSEGEYYQNGICSRCGEKEKITIQSVNNLSFAVTNEDEKTCEVIGYRKYYNDDRDNYICIPKMWNDYKVTSIGLSAFSNCASLSSIIVKEGNSVYDSREDCNAIIETSTNTLIAGCVTTIIPDSVTSIGSNAFYGCRSLSSIVIPDSVNSINDGAFSDCDSLWSVTIGNGVTSIGSSVFGFCDSLSSIVIPNSVTSIDCRTFLCCTSLSSIIVKEGNTVYDSREDCNAIIETSTNTLIAGCATTIIPDSVTSIGDYAFFGCTSLSSIVIPDSVNSIGNYAFAGCTSLRSITIGNGVTSIGNSAFDGCTSLRSVTIGNGVTSIGMDAFYSCSSLSSIIVKEGNSVYDSREGCNAIIETSTNTLIAGCATTIIPDSVTSIGNSAFYGCLSLSSIVIPDSVTSIGYFAFDGCTSLSDVYYIGSEEQWNAIYIGPYNDELKSATIHYNYVG